VLKDSNQLIFLHNYSHIRQQKSSIDQDCKFSVDCFKFRCIHQCNGVRGDRCIPKFVPHHLSAMISKYEAHLNLILKRYITHASCKQAIANVMQSNFEINMYGPCMIIIL
jgi:hypothetical protein